MKKFILGIDQGTTGSTAILMDEKLKALASSNVEFPQIYPKPGWVEHNPDEIWKSVLKAIQNVIKKTKIRPKNILCIGITNQRETVVAWDKKTSRPLHNAIVWQCRRTADLCSALKARGLEDEFHSKTGLWLDPYFSGTKIKWLLDNKVKGENFSNLKCGTIDTFLIDRLTHGEAFVTDATNASRTLLYNINDLKWDKNLLEYLNVPEDILPTVHPSASTFGYTKGLKILPDGLPITAVLGDQQAALFGQKCFTEGSLKCTYGTGAFILLNTGNKPIYSNNKLLTTIAWQTPSEVIYALEGSVFIAGAAVQWLRDGLKLIKKASDIELLAKKVKSSEGLYFVPALTGLGAPYWAPNTRGILTGINRGTNQNHIARATLESIAFQVNDLIGCMQNDLGKKIISFSVDGGASNNNMLMQFQADLFQNSIFRPKNIESTSFGACLMAYICYKNGTMNIREYSNVPTQKTVFSPKVNEHSMDIHKAGWKKAIERCLI